jgi:hypothetical protein
MLLKIVQDTPHCMFLVLAYAVAQINGKMVINNNLRAGMKADMSEFTVIIKHIPTELTDMNVQASTSYYLFICS